MFTAAQDTSYQHTLIDMLRHSLMLNTLVNVFKMGNVLLIFTRFLQDLGAEP